jgi:hypothetical protein
MFTSNHHHEFLSRHRHSTFKTYFEDTISVLSYMGMAPADADVSSVVISGLHKASLKLCGKATHAKVAPLQV